MRLSSKHLWILLAIPVAAALVMATKFAHAGPIVAVTINNPGPQGAIPSLGASFTVSGKYRGTGVEIRVDVCEADANWNYVRDSNGNIIIAGSSYISVPASVMGFANWQLTMPSPAYPGEHYILVASYLYDDGGLVTDVFEQEVYSD